ncbi:hypothetical protein LPB72_17420 [Hydrogenophaga crassostreae]|uniref:Uncharacterized protein n=1 Tax=Hydrogenophaga crassostreae TaxID=1763535 RepID=A0A162P1Q5_9BURK|nr:DUF6544 family protein [Hydrogenophaga crassostreae]AOW15480.1 hypothetical protein LPB072_07925 [Hydrogenophaga crassostreae]OAD40267.1 hypothetical protein LPB72_17420 [Hydrogenophaga crassostreae]
MKTSFIVVVVAALAFLSITALGRWRWQGMTQGLVDRVEAGRTPMGTTRFDAVELDGLPPVVQRYFRTVLPEGTPIITGASVEHKGGFNMGEAGDNWKPFTSRQRVVMRRPGFVWDARIAMLPGLTVNVHDAYVEGEGILHPAILGLFSLMELRGTGEMAQGELMRFFAEAAWYPTALLPSQGVQWTGLDEHSATATMSDGPLTLSLTFTFSADGLIDVVRAEARGRTVGGQIVMRPWEGRWSNYQMRDGMRIPVTGEVAWLLPPEEGGRKPYWRGTIADLTYDFATTATGK